MERQLINFAGDMDDVFFYRLCILGNGQGSPIKTELFCFRLAILQRMVYLYRCIASVQPHMPILPRFYFIDFTENAAFGVRNFFRYRN